MNPITNKFEQLIAVPAAEPSEALLKALEGKVLDEASTRLLRPDGSPVPPHWSTYQVGEIVFLKGYEFRVAYIGESTLLLEPFGPCLVGKAGG